MTVSVVDVDRWDAGDVREVFHATRNRAEAAFEASNGIATLPAFGTWGGTAADAAKTAVEATRKDLDSHGNEVLVVAQAASRAAEDIEQVKSDLAALRADAEKLGMAIDSATSTVVAGPGAAGAPEMEIELKREQLQPRLDAILRAAAAADTELTQAINMASGKQPIPAQPSSQGNGGAGAGPGQAGQPVHQQSGTAPGSSKDFLDQWQNAIAPPGLAGSPDPHTAQVAPALDPNSPAVKAAADQMRRMLEAQGVPPGQIDAQVAAIFQRSQQPLPAAPKPEPPTKQPAPGIGEQLGNAFNDFTNDVNEGFYDRAGQTLNTVENLTGIGGEGHPGVVESWKQMMIDNAKQALTDPAGVAGPGNPLSAFSAAAHDVPEAINNPGHYMGEKLFDGTAMAATLPLGGEGALGRALMPEMRALEHGALPGVGAFTHDAVPGIPHNVIDLPPAGEHPLGSPVSGSHDLPTSGDHSPSPPTGHLPPYGDPGSFGYDVDGDRLPYANSRPDYGPTQVNDVWDLSRDEQIARINGGLVDLPMPGPTEQWVRVLDDAQPPTMHVDGDGGRHGLINWVPETPRGGVWDMGHVSGQEYRDLRQEYLNGDLTFDQFMAQYRDPDNYRVQDPGRNRSHVDEGP